MSYHEMEVDFISVIDQVLLYHRETCIDSHVNADPKTREKLYDKAEAAREIMMLLGKELLTEEQHERFKAAMKEKLGAVYQTVFFDPATRKLIKQAKELRNGGD